MVPWMINDLFFFSILAQETSRGSKGSSASFPLGVPGSARDDGDGGAK